LQKTENKFETSEESQDRSSIKNFHGKIKDETDQISKNMLSRFSTGCPIFNCL
jgi:hypothetical protein